MSVMLKMFSQSCQVVIEILEKIAGVNIYFHLGVAPLSHTPPTLNIPSASPGSRITPRLYSKPSLSAPVCPCAATLTALWHIGPSASLPSNQDILHKAGFCILCIHWVAQCLFDDIIHLAFKPFSRHLTRLLPFSLFWMQCLCGLL